MDETDMGKTYKEYIEIGIKAELEAIAFYNFLISIEKNGNVQRSWIHIRDEEKDHLKILKKIKGSV